MPKGWGLDSLLGGPAELQLQLADLERFEDKHNDQLGFHARNIMAVAPEVRVTSPATESGASASLLRMTASFATPAHLGSRPPRAWMASLLRTLHLSDAACAAVWTIQTAHMETMDN